MLGYKMSDIGIETLITDSMRDRLSVSMCRRIGKFTASGFDRYLFDRKAIVYNPSPRLASRYHPEIGGGATSVTCICTEVFPTGWRRYLPMPSHERRNQVLELRKYTPKLSKKVADYYLEHVVV